MTFDRQAWLKELKTNLKKIFPHLPMGDVRDIMRQLEKRSSVAFSKDLGIPEICRAAVIAHVRHNYTYYDKWRRLGEERADLRQQLTDVTDYFLNVYKTGKIDPVKEDELIEKHGTLLREKKRRRK